MIDALGPPVLIAIEDAVILGAALHASGGDFATAFGRS